MVLCQGEFIGEGYYYLCGLGKASLGEGTGLLEAETQW